MENIRVLRMKCFGSNIYSTDINSVAFEELSFIAHLAKPHTDNYEIRCISIDDMEYVFPEASIEKIDHMWNILTDTQSYSVISNDVSKFERYRLTIFNKICEWCA